MSHIELNVPNMYNLIDETLSRQITLINQTLKDSNTNEASDINEAIHIESNLPLHYSIVQDLKTHGYQVDQTYDNDIKVYKIVITPLTFVKVAGYTRKKYNFWSYILMSFSECFGIIMND